MNKENTLLQIISDLTTDTVLQDKVIALYQDHKNETTILNQYAWKVDHVKRYSYDEFYEIFYNTYSEVIKATRQIDDEWEVRIRKISEGEYLVHDYGEDYECFFTYGSICIRKEDAISNLSLKLPSFGWDIHDDGDGAELNKEDVEYLSKKNIIQKETWFHNNAIENVDGGVAYRTKEEWEDIFFNAPYSSTYFEVEEGGLTEAQEYRLSQIDDGFKRIKSLDQLREEMPYLLTKCYELVMNINV